MKAQILLAAIFASLAFGPRGSAQSADWPEIVWREPQVRYLLADMTLDVNVNLYRDYATTEPEPEPDSREAIRLGDTGARVVNTNEFERRWVTNQFGKDGRVMRGVLRGSNRTITGNQVLLASDRVLDRSIVRYTLADLRLGRPVSHYEKLRADASEITEVLRRWHAGDRLLNTKWFEKDSNGDVFNIVYRGKKADGKTLITREGSNEHISGSEVNLSSDRP